ncbi:12864_t:CDS:2, partial [Cetraspora pellucida]
RVSWKSKKEEFELYCRDLNLYLRDQNVNKDLREKWNELTESQYLFWDPSTACFACGPRYLVVEFEYSISFRILVQLALLVVPGDPSTACFACGPSTACFARGPEGILVRLALLVVPGDPSTACFACDVMEGCDKQYRRNNFLLFMDNLQKDLEHTVLNEDSATTVTFRRLDLQDPKDLLNPLFYGTNKKKRKN